MRTDIESDALGLRAALRDLVALSAIPTAWVGKEPLIVATGLADALVELLQLEFAFVRLTGPGGGGTVEVTRGNAWPSFQDWLASHVAADSNLRRKEVVPEASGDSKVCRGLVIPVGFNGERGLVAAACRRSDFPRLIDELLMSLAANHAATAFQTACAEESLRHARDELEMKVAERTAELAASRRRIVTASDEARRRIERNLHDGAQQRLVSISLALRDAGVDIPPELRSLQERMNSFADEVVEVVDDLRELAGGIHPAVLLERGLGRALQTLARRASLPVHLELGPDKRFPQPIEVGAYYVVSEALTNAAKHSRASHARISLDEQHGQVQLSIEDDGVGGADPRHGSGLIGMRDRVEALGGALTVESPPGEGTTLRITLPLAGEGHCDESL